MARRSTRKANGIFSRLYSPVGHLFAAGKESVGAVTNTAKGVVGTTINGVNRIGTSVTGHANLAVSGLLSGKSRRANRKSRKGGARKTRRATTRKTRRARRTHRK